MTPEQMLVAIAEDQGWEYHGDKSWKKAGNVSNLFYWKNEELNKAYSQLPNYPSDLNACHEFEEKMTPLDHQHFCLFLHKLIMGTMDNFDINGTCNLECISRVVKATALQRCEAFCRMKWPERFSK